MPEFEGGLVRNGEIVFKGVLNIDLQPNTGQPRFPRDGTFASASDPKLDNRTPYWLALDDGRGQLLSFMEQPNRTDGF